MLMLMLILKWLTKLQTVSITDIACNEHAVNIFSLLSAAVASLDGFVLHAAY